MRSDHLPTLDEARSWIGDRVDEMGGASVAKVYSVFVDQESGDPVWVVIRLGRFRRYTAVPFVDCAPGSGRIWVAYERDAIRDAPQIDPTQPLTRENELQMCEHYGIHERLGRAAAITERPEGTITARSASA